MTKKHSAPSETAATGISHSFAVSARVIVRTSLVASLGVLLANCAGQQQHSRYSAQQQREIGAFASSKYGTASPRMYADNGAAMPKGGGREHIGKSYSVAGRRYTPHDRPVGAAQIGLASWYGAAFHGRKTANGEIYDRRSYTAAHPTMPLPSYARVTNTRNGASIIVRVNDRGPYHGGRIMDVSERVADALAFKSSGTGRVKVEYLGRASVAGSDDVKLAQSLSTSTPAVASYIPTSYSVNSGTRVAMAAEPVASAPPVVAAAYSPRPTTTEPEVEAEAADETPKSAAAAQPAKATAKVAGKPQPVDETRGVKGLAMNKADKEASEPQATTKSASAAPKPVSLPSDAKANPLADKAGAGRKTPESASAFAPAKAKSGKFDINDPMSKLAPKKADGVKSKVVTTSAATAGGFY